MNTDHRVLSSDERFYLYVLSHVPELGAVSIRRVFETCPSPELLAAALCKAQKKAAHLSYDDISSDKSSQPDTSYGCCEDLDAAETAAETVAETAAETVAETAAELALSTRQCDGIRLAYQHIDEMRREYDELPSRGIRFITYYDAEYPSRLRDIHAAPMVLYVMGGLPDDSLPSVAIVGSRGCTNYGSSMTRYFAQQLAEAGIAIISGMAYGIDTWAHMGALDVPTGMTYAVLGCGVNICYPQENYDIYKIMSLGGRGGVISEVIPGMKPLKKHFPMRNRIISGLADAVLIMEAREKSGSLITADLALEHGRDILALPGRVTDPLSRGCNSLIDTGARILRSPDDVIELLGISRSGRLEMAARDISSLSEDEQRIYRSIDTDPHYVQDIADATGMSPGRIISILLDLELKGYVTQVSANYYSALP